VPGDFLLLLPLVLLLRSSLFLGILPVTSDLRAYQNHSDDGSAAQQDRASLLFPDGTGGRLQAKAGALECAKRIAAGSAKACGSRPP
jgi:hypothetical protein